MADGVKKVNEYIMKDNRTLVVTDVTAFGVVPFGTVYADPVTGNIKVKKSEGGEVTWSSLKPEVLFQGSPISGSLLSPGSIDGEKIATNAITLEKIADNSVSSSKLASNAVITSKIADGAVTEAKLANLTITGAKIANATLGDAQIISGGISSNSLANSAVTTIKLADASVIEGKIGTGAVTEVKLATDSVASIKIKAGAVTLVKLAADSVDATKIVNSAVTSTKLGPASVTAEKLAPLAVGTANIIDGSVTGGKIATSSIVNGHFADNSLDGWKLKDATISITKIDSTFRQSVDNAIRVNTMGVAAVTGNLTVSGNITATGNITGTKVFNAVLSDLAEGYVPGEKLEAGDIVEIREDGKVYKAAVIGTAVVGVISEGFAACYGADPEEIESGAKVAVGLIGRVPVKVSGKVKIGDKIRCDGDGIGTVATNWGVLGKALESKTTEDIGTVLCLIFPSS